MSTAHVSKERRPDTSAAARTRLLISLPQIAALAKVRRPVVSVWRDRFRAGPAAFPTAVDARAGREYFDANQVAQWLIETSHGNNPDAVADAAAFAMTIITEDIQTKNAATNHHAAIEALLALRVSDGEPLTAGDLAQRARNVDAGDESLLSEIIEAPETTTLASFVEQMIDAAYSPLGAWESLQAQRLSSSGTGSAGAVSPVGAEFIGQLTMALADAEDVVLVDAADDLGSGDLFATAVRRCDESADLHVLGSSRALRREMIIHGRSPILTTQLPHPSRPAVWIARLRGASPDAELAQLEELIVELSDNQLLVVVGPDSLLVEPLTGSGETSREYALRSGRVRGIVRLPAGLVPSAARQSLAVWVIGGPQGGTPLADRFTVVGDLRGLSLTTARTQDLVSDLVAALGTAREAMSHAFRFARFVRTSTLLAGSTSLVAASWPSSARRSEDPAELTALIDQKIVELNDPSLTMRLQSSSRHQERSVSLSDAVDAGEARIFSGSRLRPDDTVAADGYPVLGRDEVTAGAASARLIDRVSLGVDYPRAQLTLPGDVIIVTGAAPSALVDLDGSSVVEYPSRILRLFDATLVPEVAAADINRLSDPMPWRRWSIRRVRSEQADALRTVFADIAAARVDAERRVAQLHELESLVTDAATAGALITATNDNTSDLNDPEGTE